MPFGMPLWRHGVAKRKPAGSTEYSERRLLEIAEKCPVHRTLLGEIKIDTVLARKPDKD